MAASECQTSLINRSGHCKHLQVSFGWLVFSNPPWKLERCTLYPLVACHMSGQVPPCFLPLYEVQLSVYLTGCVMCEQQNARLLRFRWLPGMARGEVVIVMAGLREAAYSVSKYCYWTFFCIATHMHLIVWMVVA